MKNLTFPLKVTLYQEPAGPSEIKIFESRDALEAEVARLAGGSAANAQRLVEDILRGDSVSVETGEAEWTLHADEDPTMQT